MKIVGSTVGTTMPRANLQQDNPKKADYVIGKDDYMDGAVAAGLGKLKAQFYFPPLGSGGEAGSSAIMTVGTKCILFDCGPTLNWEAIKEYYTELYEDKVFTNIDMIVISHYHYDHIENIGPILDLFPHKNCLVYLPMNHNGYMAEDNYKESLWRRDNVISALTERNVDYIEVDKETEVSLLPGFCNMTLFNSSAEDYAYYLENSVEYNDYSMCALIQTGEMYSMFPGDIGITAQRRIAATRVIPRLVVYPIHHHGFENEDAPEYLEMIRPEYGIISANYTRMVDGTIDSMAANYATENLFSTAYSKCEFVVGSYGGAVVHGKEIVQCGWSYNYINLYVDNEYTGTVHDGSAEHPFTNINECIMFVNENRQVNVTVNIKATATPYPYLWLRNIYRRIVLQGYSEDGTSKPIIKGAYVYSDGCVEFNDLCFSGEGREFGEGNDYRVIYVVASNLIIDECEIASTENSLDTLRSAIYCNKNAYVYISNSSIHDCYYGVYSNSDSTVIANVISFANVTRCYRLAHLDLQINGDDVLADDVTTYVLGNLGNGTQYRIAARSSSSNIEALVAKNTDSVVSNPFYYGGDLCVTHGTGIFKLATEDKVVKTVNGTAPDENGNVEIVSNNWTQVVAGYSLGVSGSIGISLTKLLSGYTAVYLAFTAIDTGYAYTLTVPLAFLYTSETVFVLPGGEMVGITKTTSTMTITNKSEKSYLVFAYGLV